MKNKLLIIALLGAGGCSLRGHIDVCSENGCMQSSTQTVTNDDKQGPAFWKNIGALFGGGNVTYPTPTPTTTTTTVEVK